MMHDWAFAWGWGGIWFGPFFMIAGPVLLIVLAVLLVRWLTTSGDGMRERAKTARQILDDRLAKGEIARDEYEERRKVLGA
jgi:putative membrane protein